MKALFALAPFILLGPTVLAPATDLAFGVAKGAKITKTFESGMDLELSDLNVKVGENEIPKEQLQGAMELTMNVKEMLEIVDEYSALESGLPSKVVRKFEKAQREHREHQAQAGGEAKDENKDKTSELEGKQVVFTLKDGEYKATYVEEGGDTELLEKLDEDTDLRNILPGKSVSPGDTWKLETRKVMDALAPGGSNGYKKDADDDGSDEKLDENFKGDTEATFKEIREVDGRKCAVIVLEITGESSAPAKMEEQDATLSLEVDLEGEVLWDIEAKRFHSFEVQGEATMTVEFTQEVDAGGQPMELEIKVEMSGKMVFKGSASE